MRSKNNELHFPAICILSPSEAKRIAFVIGIEDLQRMTSLIAIGSIYLVDLDFLILMKNGEDAFSIADLFNVLQFPSVAICRHLKDPLGSICCLQRLRLPDRPCEMHFQLRKGSDPLSAFIE